MMPKKSPLAGIGPAELFDSPATAACAECLRYFDVLHDVLGSMLFDGDDPAKLRERAWDALAILEEATNVLLLEEIDPAKSVV